MPTITVDIRTSLSYPVMMFDLDDELQALKKAGLLRTLPGVEARIRIDGCRLSRARVSVYPHVNSATLEEQLRQAGSFRRRIIVTDAVFSMDGDIAPLPPAGCHCQG